MTFDSYFCMQGLISKWVLYSLFKHDIFFCEVLLSLNFVISYKINDSRTLKKICLHSFYVCFTTHNLDSHFFDEKWAFKNKAGLLFIKTSFSKVYQMFALFFPKKVAKLDLKIIIFLFVGNDWFLVHIYVSVTSVYGIYIFDGWSKLVGFLAKKQHTYSNKIINFVNTMFELLKKIVHHFIK